MLHKRILDLFYEMPEKCKELSMRLYDGKKIMCVIPQNISPQHKLFKEMLETQAGHFSDIINTPQRDCIIVFPEHYLTPQERITFLNTLLENKALEEIIIVTTDGFIASDFISQLVTVAKINEEGDISTMPAQEKCLMINIHRFYRQTIGVSSLSGEAGRSIVQRLLDTLSPENKRPIPEGMYEQIKENISLIGEPVLEMKLNEMLEEKCNH